jgi:hypothetical protein
LAVGKAGLFSGGYVYTGDWLYQLEESTLLNLAAITSGVGIMLLVLLILGIKPWLKFHQWMFRELGGVKV